MSEPTEIRVLLVKPDDLLLIGNVGQIGDASMAQAAVQVFADMGIKVVFFMEDIDMAKALGEHSSNPREDG